MPGVVGQGLDSGGLVLAQGFGSISRIVRLCRHPERCRSGVTSSRFRHPTKQALPHVILRSDGVAGSLHVPARGFRYMASSSRRSLFLIVFVLATFGLLGMLFAQRIS